MKSKLSKTKKEFEPLKYITEEILKLKQKTSENIISIGQYLCDVKQILSHGEFTKWLEEKVDFTPRTARKFMKVYEVFGDPEAGKSTSVLNLSSEKMYLLTGLNEKDREQFIQENDVEQMSTRQLKQAIKDMKKEHRKSTETPRTDNGSVPVEDKTPTELPIDDINTKENTTSVKSNTQIQNIWEDTQKILDEVLLRTGKFYTDDNLDLNDKENLLLSRYIAKEITYEQLKETIEQNSLNIPFIFNEEEYKKYIDGLELYNSYTHYVDNYNFKTKENNSYTYYSILLEKELKYSDVVEKMYALEQGENEETRQKWIKEDDYLSIEDNITIDMGCDDCTDYICIYIDKKLFAHFDIKKIDFYNCSEKLFSHYNINKKYLKLVDKFKKQLEKDRLEQKKKIYDDTVNRARFKYIHKDETYLLMYYSHNSTDYIKVFKKYDEVANFFFDTGMNIYNSDFHTTIKKENYVKNLIEEAKKNKVDLLYMFYFHKALTEKAKRIYDTWKKQYDPFRNYKSGSGSSFNWDGFDFGFNSTKKEVSIDIFNSEELQFLKDMLADKDLWRKVYTKTAIKVHPDRFTKDGEVAVKEADSKMKLLNSINDKIQKCC